MKSIGIIRTERLHRAAARVCLLISVLICIGQTGCVSLDSNSLKRAANVASWGSPDYVTVRKSPRNPLAKQLQLLSPKSAKPSERTMQLLRQLALEETFKESPSDAMTALYRKINEGPSAEKVYAFAELAYVGGVKSEALLDSDNALDLYGAAVAYAYTWLFDTRFDNRRNPYDPEFRQVCDIYNSALEGAMRILQSRDKLKPGVTHTIDTCGVNVDLAIEAQGPWGDDEFDRLEFVSDYELGGLSNAHKTFGLGVPLIAIRKRTDSKLEKYYPDNLTFPVTAFMRFDYELGGGNRPELRSCRLELLDPMTRTDIDVAGRRTPLESDISTPLAYYLNNPVIKTNALATFALLNADFAKDFEGLYMLEPYDPEKIPVLMVHGLWSSPVTWMEMFNDLRSNAEVRDNYQFWFYLYPTGQPFWISAARLRADLAEVRETLDPERQQQALSEMVLVGHSMGGLVSKLQTIESEDDFWAIVSDKPFDDLKADDATREQIRNTLFFKPNPSVRRVITIGTPHRGSDFANDYTRWAGRAFFTLPSMLTGGAQQLVRENPDFFRNTDMLTITTSIDSLAPDSPIFPVMLKARSPGYMKYHNIVGKAPSRGWLGTYGKGVSGEGDGVVALASSRLDGTASQIEVDADHVGVHQHPKSINEVRRILATHLQEMKRERFKRWTENHPTPETRRVVYPQPLPPTSGPAAAPIRFSIGDE